jgi:hypothetical protein
MAIHRSLVSVGLRVSYSFRDEPIRTGTVSSVIIDECDEMIAEVTWDSGGDVGLFVNSSITGKEMRYYEHIEILQ